MVLSPLSHCQLAASLSSRMGKNLATMLRYAWLHKRRRQILSDLFQEQARRYPDKPAIVFTNDGRCWTFRELDDYANSVANYFSRVGLRKGDTVALFMENCPEYIGVCVGLWKIGVVAAFLNHNLRQESLIHCVRVAKSRVLVFSAALSEAVGDVREDLESGGLDVGQMCFCVCGDNDKGGVGRSLDRELQGVSTSPPPLLANKEADGEKYTPLIHSLTHALTHSLTYSVSLCADKACYVYTSGTTGLPKACVIKHTK